MLGNRTRGRRELFTQSVPFNTGDTDTTPEALNDYGFRSSSGSLAILAAIRRASSRFIAYS